MNRHLFVLCNLAFLVLLSHNIISFAATEKVYIDEILDDNDELIIKRKNGQKYFVEKGYGCLSLWRYENKNIYIESPGIFLGLGSKIILPNNSGECKIWESRLITDSYKKFSKKQKNTDSVISIGCESGHWISSISSDGSIIKLEDGSIWKVDTIDEIYTSLCMDFEEVIVCGYEMINVDNGEKVSVEKINKNQMHHLGKMSSQIQ